MADGTRGLPVVFPVHPRTPRRCRVWPGLARTAGGRAAAVSRVQLPRATCKGRDHRFRRRDRRDNGHGRALHDAARHHRAPRDGDDRHQRTRRHRPGARCSRHWTACSPAHGRKARSRKNGTARPARASPRCWTIFCAASRAGQAFWRTVRHLRAEQVRAGCGSACTGRGLTSAGTGSARRRGVPGSRRPGASRLGRARSAFVS